MNTILPIQNTKADRIAAGKARTAVQTFWLMALCLVALSITAMRWVSVAYPRHQTNHLLPFPPPGFTAIVLPYLPLLLGFGSFCIGVLVGVSWSSSFHRIIHSLPAAIVFGILVVVLGLAVGYAINAPTNQMFDLLIPKPK